jgi:hypothetical protein
MKANPPAGKPAARPRLPDNSKPMGGAAGGADKKRSLTIRPGQPVRDKKNLFVGGAMY